MGLAEVAGAAKVLGKVLQVGITGWEAWTNLGLDSKELAALHALTEALGEWAGAPAERSADMEALYLGLITRCFGQAFGRHWAFNESLAPTRLKGLRLFMDKEERKRADEIELRMGLATESLQELTRSGDATTAREWAHVGALVGGPLSTLYYAALWRAFTDSKLDDERGEPLLEPGKNGRLEFERHFQLAYYQALNSSDGQRLQPYLERLSGDYRARLLRELLLKDMAGWGERHTFGNIERRGWRAGDPVPFMPLGEMYVEPDARLGGEKRDARTPVTALIERLLGDSKKKVIIVKADFGMGKSLTARTLAQRWAERFLTARTPSPENWLPVYIRCADDLPDEGFDLEQTVRSAWKRQLDVDLKARDEVLRLPEEGQRTVFVLDGLDEVILGERRLESFFKSITRDEATERHRFIIFSRPGALPSEQELKDIPVVELLPWSAQQGETWLGRWRGLHEGRGPKYEELKARKLGELAQTPILLFMVAQTWSQHSAEAGAGLAALYEEFFWQIAKGKHEADCERHPNVSEASLQLRDHLTEEGLLAKGAEAPDAMLWLMGRVAWEATKLEQRQMLEPERKADFLTKRDIANLIVDELGVRRDASDTIDSIQVGLLLTMQAHLRAREASQLLFGHKSFREYLVTRYWADRLRVISEARERDWDELEKPLLGGRLLSREDRTFEFLMKMLNGEPLPRHPRAPFGLDESSSKRLLDWAQNRFESEAQEGVSGKQQPVLRHDRRPCFREAALAIGSSLRGSEGLRIKDKLTVRTLMAWFWLMRIAPILIAPKARWQGAVLSDLSLRGANFRNADLREVHFTNSSLTSSGGGARAPCDFSGARLDGAIMEGVDLEDARLLKASLRGARLTGADLVGALMEGADLEQAELSGTNLYVAGLWGARLVRARLRNARLSMARLSGALLRGADLFSARLDSAILSGAELCGANLRHADLEGAKLDGADLTGARYDRDTRWPDGFGPQAAGAILVEE